MDLTKRPLWILCMGLASALIFSAEAKNIDASHRKRKTKALSDVVISEITVGTGEPVQLGQILHLRYRQWLFDAKAPNGQGKLIDSNLDKTNLTVHFAEPGLLDGLKKGLTGMKVGGKRRLIVPNKLAYGANGAGRGMIPPGSDLLYELELVSVE